MGAVPIVSIIEIPQGVSGGLDQTGLLDLGGPIPAVEESVETAPPERAAGVARNSAILALGTVASRAAGMVRQIILVTAIGSEAVGSAYTYANNLPNQVYELLLGGVLASVVVPLLVKAQKTDADKGEAFIQRLLTMTLVVFAAITAVAVAAAPLLTLLVTNQSFRAGPGNVSLTNSLAYLILLEIFFYAIAAVLGAVLNSRGRFAAPAWVPVLNSVIVIATAGVFLVMHGPTPPTPQNLTGPQVLVLGLGTTMGIAVQALALWIPMRRLGFRWRWRWDWRGTGLGETRSIAGWLMLYVLLNQIGLAVVLRAAGSAAEASIGRDFGASVYNNAFILFTLPHGLVAVSVITALLPRMSRAAVDERFGDIADDLSLGTRLSSTLLIPATTLMVALGPPIGVLIYGHGNAAPLGSTIGKVAAFAALGLVPFAISQLQTFVFYAMREAKTAAFVNIPVVLMRVVGSFLVADLVPANFVLQALMIVNTGTYLLAAAVGAILLRQRLGRLHLGRTLSTLVRVTLAAVPAAAAALVVQIWLSKLIGQYIAVVAALAVGGLLYVGLALLVRVREIHEVLEQIRRRVSR
jgi:putative peptidoglycan lipid II flippase